MEPEETIAAALVRIRRAQQSARLRRRAGQGGPDAARFRYLDALSGSRTGWSISQIAEAIGVDRPRASRLTTELLDEGYVLRRPAPDDSRYTLIRLTPAGKKLVASMNANRRRAVAEALAGFTAEEAQTLAALLERFVAAWPVDARPG